MYDLFRAGHSDMQIVQFKVFDEDNGHQQDGQVELIRFPKIRRDRN